MGGLFSSNTEKQTTYRESSTLYRPTPRQYSQPSYNPQQSSPTYNYPTSAQYSQAFYTQQSLRTHRSTPSGNLNSTTSRTSKFLQPTVITRNNNLLRSIMMNCTDYEITTKEVHTITLNQIQRLFKTTGKPCMTLKSVKEINNPYLKALYELKKLDLKTTYYNLKTVELFHGTPSNNVPLINNTNFNYRYYGKGVGCKFGKGISFTPFAYYASHYCNKNNINKEMYLCEVLEGQSHVGWEGLVLPNIGFDTTKKENGHVVVKFHDDVYYPKYLISFTKVETVNAPKKRTTRSRIVAKVPFYEDDDFDYYYDY